MALPDGKQYGTNDWTTVNLSTATSARPPVIDSGILDAPCLHRTSLYASRSAW